MENSLSNWQDSLDDKLVNRLTRPLRQPGMMDMGMGERIINRCDRFLNRLPLLNQQMQRWGNTNTLSSESTKIVYAQPVSSAKEQGIENFQPTVSHQKSTVNIIQRKVDSTQSLPVNKVNNTTLSSSNFSESSPAIPVVSPQVITEDSPKTGEMPLQAKFADSPASSSQINAIAPTNQTSIIPVVSPDSPASSSQINAIAPINQTSIIPVVSPQTITEDSPKTGEMPLQAKFADSPASSSQINAIAPTNQTSIIPVVSPDSPASSSQINAIAPINQTSIIPVVSPQTITEDSPKTGEMPLQAKFADSPASSSQINAIAPTNQTSIIPVVSPQTITEDWTNSTEMPLPVSSQVDGMKMLDIKKSTSISERPLPIIQAKQQNSSPSSSSLPVVNHLHTLVSPKQTQPDSYSKTLRSIQHEKLASPIFSKNIPIVTAQPNLITINSPNPQNQSTSIINTQPVNTSNLQIQNNHNQNISPLPLVSVTSSNNPALKPQSSPLPLAKTNPSSRNISQQPQLSQQNPSLTDSSSSPKTLVHPISPTETIVNQANIDVDSIASQVERKLMRRLVIESERRGKNQWR